MRRRPAETTARAKGTRPTQFGAGAAVGGLAMFFFDPARGRTRRSLMRDKAVHGVNTLRRTTEATYRDTRNRVAGAAAEVRSNVTREEIDDEVLVERVRSKLGRLVTHPASIEVEAKEGRVMLSGPVLSDELEGLLWGVRRIRGVRDVDNRLETFDEAGNVPGLQGAGRRPRRLAKEHWSPAARLAGALSGAALLGFAGVRRGAAAVPAGVVGAGLLGRGVWDLPVRRLIGVGAGRRGIDLQKTINVDAPVDKVFSFWTDYESFPKFMTHVREVKKLGEDRSRWEVEGPGGIPIKFDALVSAFHPNERFGWKTAPGSAIKHSGLVEFRPNDDGSTRVQIRMTYNPVVGGIGHAVAELLGTDPKRRLDDDLARMKTFIETGTPPADAM